MPENEYKQALGEGQDRKNDFDPEVISDVLTKWAGDFIGDNFRRLPIAFETENPSFMKPKIRAGRIGCLGRKVDLIWEIRDDLSHFASFGKSVNLSEQERETARWLYEATYGSSSGGYKTILLNAVVKAARDQFVVSCFSEGPYWYGKNYDLFSADSLFRQNLVEQYVQIIEEYQQKRQNENVPHSSGPWAGWTDAQLYTPGFFGYLVERCTEELAFLKQVSESEFDLMMKAQQRARQGIADNLYFVLQIKP